MDVVEKARVFARAAHAAVGQRRKYTNTPYYLHPAGVVAILSTVTDDPEMLAAAWLHDTVEDTQVSIGLIAVEFRPEIAKLVAGLTDVSRPEDGNRAARKAIDRAHLATQCPRVKTIKLADLIHNTKSIVAHDPKFAKVYLAEKRLALEVLREGNPILWARASKLAGGPLWP